MHPSRSRLAWLTLGSIGLFLCCEPKEHDQCCLCSVTCNGRFNEAPVNAYGMFRKPLCEDTSQRACSEYCQSLRAECSVVFEAQKLEVTEFLPPTVRRAWVEECPADVSCLSEGDGVGGAPGLGGAGGVAGGLSAGGVAGIAGVAGVAGVAGQTGLGGAMGLGGAPMGQGGHWP